MEDFRWRRMMARDFRDSLPWLPDPGWSSPLVPRYYREDEFPSYIPPEMRPWIIPREYDPFDRRGRRWSGSDPEPVPDPRVPTNPWNPFPFPHLPFPTHPSPFPAPLPTPPKVPPPQDDDPATRPGNRLNWNGSGPTGGLIELLRLAMQRRAIKTDGRIDTNRNRMTSQQSSTGLAQPIRRLTRVTAADQD